jgi:hypothetical protein
MSYDPTLTATNDPFLPPLEARNTTSAYYPGVPTSSHRFCAPVKPGWLGLYHQLLPPPSMPFGTGAKRLLYSTKLVGKQSPNKIANNMRLLFVNHIVPAFTFLSDQSTPTKHLGCFYTPFPSTSQYELSSDDISYRRHQLGAAGRSIQDWPGEPTAISKQATLTQRHDFSRELCLPKLNSPSWT